MSVNLKHLMFTVVKCTNTVSLKVMSTLSILDQVKLTSPKLKELILHKFTSDTINLLCMIVGLMQNGARSRGPLGDVERSP